ncbi:unnamed protein product [Rhizophagus irregularis]|nr:unnamed protein product [Rhizophagus irregularis]
MPLKVALILFRYKICKLRPHNFRVFYINSITNKFRKRGGGERERGRCGETIYYPISSNYETMFDHSQHVTVETTKSERRGKPVFFGFNFT